jgi:hypothetical protein
MIKPGFIEIKDPGILYGLMTRNYHPTLAEIIMMVAGKYGLVMTESYRKQRHPNDLHGTDPVRAVDLRSRVYDGDKAQKIRDEINRLWAYDPRRPHMCCAIIHDVGEGIHFHIQVHPRTERRAHG